MQKEYIASEHFIHNELVSRCENAADRLLQLWVESKQHIHTTLLIWPAEPILASNGEDFTGVVYCTPSSDKELQRKEIVTAASKCSAFGLLLTEQLEDAVRMIFESTHGTRTWRFPIKDHGGVQVLGKPEIRDNSESIGVLWSAN